MYHTSAVAALITLFGQLTNVFSSGSTAHKLSLMHDHDYPNSQLNMTVLLKYLTPYLVDQFCMQRLYRTRSSYTYLVLKMHWLLWCCVIDASGNHVFT